MIGIVGQGFVGNAVYNKFKDYYELYTYDLDENKCNSTIEETMNNDIVFVCLPTPMNSDGSCNISIVDETIDRIFKYGVSTTVIIKSTIPPGTTKALSDKYPSLELVFNPEFLTEANAAEDFKNQNRIILGGSVESTDKVGNIFSVVFPNIPILKTDSTHAEMVKYLTNSFLATKVSFANEMYKICEKLDIDYDKVVEYSTFDERLGKSHWSVPGPDGDFGYGGHCFPKDVKALIHLSEELGMYPTMLRATDRKNDVVRTDRDWERMKGRAV